jgi:hypothetical protein
MNTWQPILVPVNGTVRAPEGYIVRDCSNEESDVWNWQNIAK